MYVVMLHHGIKQLLIVRYQRTSILIYVALMPVHNAPTLNMHNSHILKDSLFASLKTVLFPLRSQPTLIGCKSSSVAGAPYRSLHVAPQEVEVR